MSLLNPRNVPPASWLDPDDGFDGWVEEIYDHDPITEQDWEQMQDAGWLESQAELEILEYLWNGGDPILERKAAAGLLFQVYQTFKSRIKTWNDASS